MTRESTDEHIMQTLAKGDQSALAELMRRWQAAIWCFVDRMVNSPELTDDICQNVWTRLYLYRKSYRSSRPFKAYLFTIATNCCRSAFARRESHMLFSSYAESPGVDPPANDPPPLEALIFSEEVGALRGALGRLPLAERAVVLLYLLYSNDYQKIGSVLDRSTSTVRSHMHHAIRRLRRILTKISLASDRQVDHERLDK